MTAVTEIIHEEDEQTCHRAGNYLDLGFDANQAFGLARARDSKGFFIYWGDIKKMMDAGASREQVISIFL